MDISEVAPSLFIASRFYPVDGDWPESGIAIDCAMSLRDDDSPQATIIQELASAAWYLGMNHYNVVLVCEAGRNRSAIVAVWTLIKRGVPKDQALARVREVRSFLSGGALTNETFVKYLQSGFAAEYPSS